MKTLTLFLFMMSFKLLALDVYHLHLKRLYKISNVGTPEQTQTEIAYMVYDFAHTAEAVAYQSKRQLHLVTATEKLKIADNIDSFKFSGDTIAYLKGRDLYRYNLTSKENTLVDQKVGHYELRDSHLLYSKEAGSLYLVELERDGEVQKIGSNVGQFKLPQ